MTDNPAAEQFARRDAVRAEAVTAVQANRDFLQTNPTTAQLTQQVRALTQQMNILIQLQTGDYSS